MRSYAGKEDPVLNELAYYTECNLRNFHEMVLKLATKPDIRITDQILTLIVTQLAAIENLIKSSSVGNRSYEIRDAFDGAEKLFKEATHNVRILQALYGPKQSL